MDNSTNNMSQMAQVAMQSAGNIAVGQLGYKNAKKLAQYQYEQNEMAAEKAFNRSMDAWSQNNAYNTPAAQMERLQAAGLNPNLMYGQGNTGNASSVPQRSAAKYEAPQNIGQYYQMPNVIGMLGQYQQIKNMQAQERNISADTMNKIRFGDSEYTPMGYVNGEPAVVGPMNLAQYRTSSSADKNRSQTIIAQQLSSAQLANLLFRNESLNKDISLKEQVAKSKQWQLDIGNPLQEKLMDARIKEMQLRNEAEEAGFGGTDIYHSIARTLYRWWQALDGSAK